MTDPTTLLRLSALERAFASLSESQNIVPYQPASPTPPGYAHDAPRGLQPEAANNQQDSRMAAIEASIMALSNSVTLLNIQISSLTADVHEQMPPAPVINVQSHDIDDAQDRRLNGLDTLVQTLSKNMSEYNNQMGDLIATYKRLNPQSVNSTATNGPHPHATSNGARSSTGWA